MSSNTLEMKNSALPGLLQKWRLFGLIAATLALLAVAVLAIDPNVDGVRRVIRVTARTSLLLFFLAFVASALFKRSPSRWTQWLRQNRRYLGLGFALSHTIHAVAIISFATMDPVQFQIMNGTSSFIPGSIAYLFILLMSATSFDRTAAWIGPRAWKILHTGGVYYIWISFMIAYGKRIPQSLWYIAPLIVLTCALTLRLWPLSKLQRN
jgi:sulfoxide reductase heme-binding subunit YedZ